MSNSIRAVLATIITVSLVVRASGQSNRTDGSSGQFRIATPRSEYESGEPIDVTIVAANAVAPVRLMVTGGARTSVKSSESPRTTAYMLEIDAKTRLASRRIELREGGDYLLAAEAKDAAGRSLTAQRAIRVHAPHFLDGRIDAVLRDWWISTSKIKTCYAEFNRTIRDRAFGDEQAQGRAHFSHPNKARLDVFIDEGGRKEVLETYILTGAGEIWEYKPRIPQIVIWKLPPEFARQEMVEEGPLPFLLGAKPEKIKARYRLKLADENDESIHLTVHPKLEEDSQNFVKVELWLNKKDYLPAKLVFIEPNNNVVTYHFTGIWPNVELDAKNFVPVRIKGWPVVEQQVERGAPRAAQGQEKPIR